MKPWAWTLIGFGVIAAAIAGDTLFLVHPAIRNGWWTYALLAPGLVLAVVGIAKERSWATVMLTILSFLAIGLYTATRFIKTPAASAKSAEGAEFPDFGLIDQDGHSVTLYDLRHEGPVVVVLFRGRF